MSGWLDSSNNANCFKQTYVQGFVDISGGSIITRGTGGGLVIGGDSSLNGTVYLGDSIFVRSDGMVAPGTADNGATAIYVDASYSDINGREVVSGGESYDISGNAENGAEVSSSFLSSDASWSQLGFDIDGEASVDQSGYSVSMINSATYGLVVAIGAQYNDGTSTNTNDNRGHVRVYQYKQFTEDMSGNYHYTSQAQNTSDQTNPLIITADTETAPQNGNYYWTQLGADIDGENAGVYSGWSVSLVDSANGLVVAIGAPYNVGSRGLVCVYQYSDSNWTKLGADIDGEAASDYSGWSVSLVDSANGLVVAIGAYQNDGIGGDAGHVRVYQYKQFTEDMSGNYHYTSQAQNTSDQTNPLIITADNSTAPVAGTYYWTQIGLDINGKAEQNWFGHSVSLVDSSNNGLVVAIGANLNDDNSNFSGHVRVYQYSNSNSSWTKLGADIRGEAINDRSGHSVSLVDSSNNGLVVAIGANLNNGTSDADRGHVRVYQYSNSNSSWTKLGADIDGEAAGDQSGSSISLVDSANGLVVAIGAFFNGSQSGHVRVYQYDADKTTAQPNQDLANYGPVGWRRLGADIDGEAASDRSGASVSLVDSANGLVVAIGATSNDGTDSTDTNRGHVRVYELPYTKVYSDVFGYTDVSVIDGYLNDGLTSAALYVNGDTDLSGGLTVSGDVSFNVGNLFVAGDLSLNGNLFINSFAANSINANAIDSTVDIEFANKLSVSTSDISFSTTGLQVATDFNSDNTPINLAANLTVPANIAIVDGSNGTVYGSYLTLTNKDATAYYNVGKSASGIFNIVDQASAGVYLASGGTSFTGTSDARLKTNIVPLESATDKIMALNPCTYQWKSEVESTNTDNTSEQTKPHVGFIAQEVEKIMPELVHNIDHPAGPDYKGVNMTDMIPYLIRTIQEQNAELDELTERLAKLSA